MQSTVLVFATHTDLSHQAWKICLLKPQYQSDENTQASVNSPVFSNMGKRSDQLGFRNQTFFKIASHSLLCAGA